MNERLVMTVMVKNERDIIAANIRTHASLGVDAFVVLDNASEDGTPEIVQELAKEYEIDLLHEPSQTYRQRQWMTRLARYAKKKFGARWVISNDADEFWIPETDGLKQYLRRNDWVVSCRRVNMLPERSGVGACQWAVKRPILYDKSDQMGSESISMLLAPIKPKVIVNPSGLIRMKGGNHRAQHIMGFRQREERGITIHHVPIRSYEHFEANIRQRQRLLNEVKDVRMGNHYRRWVRLLVEGKLCEEYERFFFNEKEVDALKRLGVLEQSGRFQEVLKP